MGARGAIENLMTRYTELLDEGDFDALGAMFTHGEVVIEGGPHSGLHARGAVDAAELWRSIVQLDAHGRTGTRHLTGNVFIEVDKERGTAVGRCYFCVLQQTATLSLQAVAAGGYHDTYRNIDGTWWFHTRRIVCDQTGDLTQHMEGSRPS